ncbi:MAG: STAS-like domain-containing protein [Flavobacteriales bacterium]|nr:STAS-like domain-containing protein [Flavobacteriales bacterium]
MRTVSLEEYGPILSSRSIGEVVYERIKKEVNEGEVTVDLSTIRSMATFCAKQIFGRLYVELGQRKFFDRLTIKGADDNLKTIIQIGIQNALEEAPKA